MAGIMNKTARQYNLKCIDKNGRRVTVRIAPGFNVVNDDHWGPFKTDKYVTDLRKKDLIDFGKKFDDMEMDQDPDTVAKSKAVTIPSGDNSKQLSEREQAQADLDKIAAQKLLDAQGNDSDDDDL